MRFPHNFRIVMSYQVLARKYRPRSFESLVGQEHVVRALTHALEQKRLHHAYLFTGTRGVGKTTLSRILAKCLNCIGADGNGDITAHPCGACEACVAIDAGRFVDYIEMDAASNRGVDDMAQLLEQAVYAPSNARFKVYMIDEVHMLSNQAFNAMLKTLEEPPPHVKFILATTDPQKIPVTVLSRCLQFNLKQMPPGHIVGHLENILGQEDIAFETPALRLLAQGAHGSMRDALSLTDQAIAYAAGKVTLDAVQSMLGALDQSFLVRLLDALAADDGAGLLAVADDMAARSLSYDAALQDLGSLLHRIALAQLAPAALPEDVPEREHILRLAGIFSAEEVQLYYQIAVHGRNELALAPDDYAGFTMSLLRMLAFRPGNAPAEEAPAPRVAQEAPPVRIAPKPAPAAAPAPTAAAAPAGRAASGAMSPARAALEAARGLKRGASPSAPAPAAGPSSVAEAAPAAFVAAVPPKRPAPSDAPPWDDDFPPFDDFEPAQKKTEPPAVAARPTVEEASAAATLAPAPAPAPAYEAPPQRPVPELDWDGDWPQLASALPVRGVAHQLAQQSELLECAQEGNTFVFRLRVPVDTLCSLISLEKLTAALAERFGKPVRLQHEIGPVRHTANAKAEAERAARQKEAEQTMHSDPFLQTLMREFGATIVPGSIKPV
jgi:DNA polymerase-3 subunit gamma/tau